MNGWILLLICNFWLWFSIGCSKTLTDTTDGQNISISPPVYTDEISFTKAKNSRNLLGKLNEEYKIGPGDVLEISIFEWELRGESKTARFIVSETGRISIPVVDSIQIGGNSVAVVKSKIEDALRDGGFIRHPRVSVDISEYRSKRISVVGNVGDPGVYTLRRNATTLLEILSLAGGITENAGQFLTVIRSSSGEGVDQGFPAQKSENEKVVSSEFFQEKITIDLFELLELGNHYLNMVIQPGDLINVPSAKYISVVGHVKSPGKFPLKQPTTILDAIAMANGMDSESASPKFCALKRKSEDGEDLIPLDIEGIKTGEKPNFYLLPSDIIDIRQTANKKFTRNLLSSLERIFSVGFRLD